MPDKRKDEELESYYIEQKSKKSSRVRGKATVQKATCPECSTIGKHPVYKREPWTVLECVFCSFKFRSVGNC